MKQLLKISEIVAALLRIYPETRDDDRLLYYMVCSYILHQNGESESNYTVKEFFESDLLPAPETVRRSRQKIQSERIDLQGKKRTERMERQDIFRAFAKEKVSSII